MIRYAIVRGARTRSETEAYLPGNYRVIATFTNETVIAGMDLAGWTLDGYVIPRYLSGGIACEEIDLSHPIMKGIPSNA